MYSDLNLSWISPDPRVRENIIRELDIYAGLILEIGVALKKGQSLCIASAPENYDFARILSMKAYEMGASYVHISLQDRLILASRIMHQNIEELTIHQDFEIGMHSLFASETWGYIKLENTEDALLLEHADPNLLSAYQASRRKAFGDFYKKVLQYGIPWCIAAVPGPVWARQVLGDQATVEDLWTLLRQILRLDNAHPAESWRQHGALLEHHARSLTHLHLKQLHITTPEGTDLDVGIHTRARWIGGGEYLPDGTLFFPNIPTEEIFTAPDCFAVSGNLVTTRPIAVLGGLVEGVRLVIDKGSVIKSTAATGGQLLERYFEIDEGARRTGEIALVSASSPLSLADRIFGSILFDENASCHIAFGAGYPSCFREPETLQTDEDLLDVHCNVSHVHTDFMFGSAGTRIEALCHDGRELLLMEHGELLLPR